MVINVDKEGQQAIEWLIDIALRAEGIKGANNAFTVLQSVRVVDVDNKVGQNPTSGKEPTL